MYNALHDQLTPTTWKLLGALPIVATVALVVLKLAEVVPS